MQISHYSRLRCRTQCHLQLSIRPGKRTATRYAAARVSGMKFRVRPAKKTHWGRDFYGVITFQRKRNFAESQSSRQRLPRLFAFFSHPLSLLSAYDKNTDASDRHLPFLTFQINAFVIFLWLLFYVYHFFFTREWLKFGNVWGLPDLRQHFVRVFFNLRDHLAGFSHTDGTPAWIQTILKAIRFLWAVHGAYTFETSSKRFGHVTALCSNTCDWKNFHAFRDSSSLCNLPKLLGYLSI